MRNLLIIPQPIIHYSPYEKWMDSLREQENFLLTSDHSLGLFPTDATAHPPFTFIEKFSSYETNGLLEVRAYELGQKYRFDRILSIAEFDLMRAAKLREALNIEGQSSESALLFRDKFSMKQRAQKHGVKVPEFRLVSEPLQLLSFVEQVGFPIVVKPPSGSGSEDTHILRTQKEFSDFLKNKFHPNSLWNTTWLAESFIEGEMFHIDGLVIDQKPRIVTPSKYVNGCMAYMAEQWVASYTLDHKSSLSKRLVQYVEDLLIRVFPTPQHSLFHIEVFLTPSNELVLCEVASRLGGGRINDTLRTTHNFDIKMEYVKTICRGPKYVEVPSVFYAGRSPAAGFLIMPHRQGILKKLPESCPFPWIENYRTKGKVGEKFDRPKTSTDQVASFVIRGASEVEVQARITEAASWFEKSVQWKLEKDV